jgi:hypothetical protein
MLQWPWIVLLQWRAEIKAIVLWDVTSWSVVEIFRRFWGNFCLRIHGWKVLYSVNEGRFFVQTICEFSQVLCPDECSCYFFRKICKFLPHS